MTNTEIIQAIKSEIERLKDENNNIRCDHNKAYCQGYGDAFVDLLPFLDTLESENTMSQEELELNSLAYLEQLGYTCIPEGAHTVEWDENEDGWMYEWCLKILFDYGCAEWLAEKIKDLRSHPMMITKNTNSHDKRTDSQGQGRD